jgi:subtilisin
MNNHWLKSRAAIATLILFSLLPVTPSVRTAVAASLALPQPDSSFETDGVIPGSYIVVLRDGAVVTASADGVSQFSTGVHVTHQFDSAIRGFSAEMPASEAAKLQNDPRVASVVPDRIIYQAGGSFDHSIDRVNAEINPVSHIDGVDAPRVNVDVAIIDGGVGPSSMINIVGGKNCTNAPNYDDESAHGTFVAGLVAGFDNSNGHPGVVPGARIWSVKVMRGDRGTWSDFICGVDWVTSMAGTIEVANISLSGPYSYNEPDCESSLVHAAICRMVDAGVTVVVAAGNFAGSAYSYIPARYSEVITVSAIADSDGKPGGLGPSIDGVSDDHFWPESDNGPAVDIAAPGVEVCSILLYFPYYGCGSGTSFAAPLVAGAAAAYIVQNGRVGPKAVRAALIAQRDPAHIAGDTDSVDEGVLNASGRSFAQLELSRTSAQVDQPLVLTIKGFRPRETVTVKFDSLVKSTITVDASGAGIVSFKVPAATKGDHAITASSRNYFIKKTLTISPRIRLSSSAGTPGSGLDISLRGFARKQRVSIKWLNGNSNVTLASVITSNTGSANLHLTVPSSFKGDHSIIAVPSSGGSVSASYVVAPNVKLSRTSGASGTSATLTFKGFASAESVRVYLVNGTSKKLIRTKTVSAAGSAVSIVTIPLTAALGTHSISVEGSQGSYVASNFSVTSIGESSDSSPTPTATQTATVPPSPEVTETPSETPTDIATVIPTETATEAASETPTAAPTEVPSETPTEVPTEIPTETASPTPTVVPTDTPAIEETATATD